MDANGCATSCTSVVVLCRPARATAGTTVAGDGVGGRCRPALGADQGHEAHRAEILGHELVAPTSGPDQVLGPCLVADRDHESAAVGQLLDQRLGTAGPRR